MNFTKKFKESLKSWGGIRAAELVDCDHMTRDINLDISGYPYKDWKGHDEWEAIFLNAFIKQELTLLDDGPNNIHQLSDMTESPIELQLLFGIIISARENQVRSVKIVGKCEDYITKAKTKNVEIELLKISNGENYNKLLIEPQKKIGKYRVDFLLTFTGVRQWTFDDSGNRIPVKKIMNQVVIECDGHDFHEKSKEQAKRDKSRDRTLQSVGYKVYHFTGSEIYQDNMKCAELIIRDLTEDSFKLWLSDDEGEEYFK